MALIQCKECKQQISDSAKVCPSCGKKVTRGAGVGTIVLALFIIYVVIKAAGSNTTSGSNNSSSESEAAPQASAQAPVDVDLQTILSAYKGNEVAADNLYKGKTIRVSGRVGDIKKDIMNSLYVTIGTGAQFEIPEIQAFFDDNKNDQLARLTKGQIVTVVCRVDGLMMNVLLKDCALN